MTAPNNLVLDSGKLLIAEALAMNTQFQVGRARIGEGVGFTLNGSAASPSPVVIYTVGPENISNQIVNTNVAQFNITLTEIMGDFSVGNVMLDFLINGVYIPFVWWVSDIAINKTAQSSIDVGNRFIVSFNVEFLNISDAIAITVTTPTYSSLPSYLNELSLPSPAQALYQEFALQQYTETETPALGMRRSSDNTYFGLPFLQRLDHPYFGSLRGGATGDNYLPYTGLIYWGGYLISPPSDFLSTVGGALLTDTVFGPQAGGELLSYVQT